MGITEEVNTNQRNLSNDTLLEYIDKEIDFVRTEIQSPGWSTWALVVAAGYLGWLLLEEAELQKHNINSITIIILLVHYLMLILNNDDLLIKHFQKNNPKPLWVEAARFSAAILVITYLSKHISFRANLIGYVINGLIIIAILFSTFWIKKFENIFGSDIESPLGKTTVFRVFGFLFAVFLAALIIITSIDYAWLFIKLNEPLIPNIRLAGLIIGIYYILYTLSASNTEKATIQSLVELRRWFIQGKINTSDLIKRVDVIMSGLKFSDLIQEDVSKVITVLQNIDLEFAKITKKEDVLERLYGKLKDEAQEGEDIIKDSLLLSIISHFLNITKYYETLRSQSLRSFLKKQLLAQSTNHLKLRTSEYSENIQALLDDLEKKYSDSSDRFIALLNSHESQETLDYWQKKMDDVYIYKIDLPREPQK